MTNPREDLMTLTDVAHTAGVRPSAVSNWRKRWADFPVAVEDGRFPRVEVEAWLRLHGREVRDPEPAGEWSILWKAADSLRGSADVEDVFELLVQLLAVRAASERGAGRFWRELTADRSVPIGSSLERVALEVATNDPSLGAALAPSSSSRRIPASVASPLVDAIGVLPQNTDWGRFASGLASDFPERYGLRGAEMFTPPGLSELMVGLLEPIQGSVYDPACGAGTLLANAWQRAEQRNVVLYGQDISPQAQRFARLILSTIPVRSELTLGDTLLDDRMPGLLADRVIAQPPIGQRVTFAGSFRFDPRWDWGVPSSFADWLWVQHAAAHLAPGGMGVVAMGPGALFRGASEAGIRRGLLESDLLDAVIQLPPAMLPATSLSPILLVLQKGRANRSRQVLFLDAGKKSERERGGLTRLPADELRGVLDNVRRWRRGDDPSRERGATIATLDEILRNDANLLPAQYVGALPHVAAEPIGMRYRQLSELVSERLAALPADLISLRAELADLEVVE